MFYTEDRLPGVDGQAIFYRLWQPDAQPRALLLVAHGLAEHSGRYLQFAQHFVTRGFAIAALDHVGHGQSEGERCYVERFSEFIETLELFRQQMCRALPDLPVFLVGHSMGGLISASYLLSYQRNLAGCILSGAALQAVEQPSALAVAVMKWLSALFPRLGVLKLEAAAVSRDERVMRAYLSDPLVYRDRLSARLAVELFDTMAPVNRRAAEIIVPVLVMHGEADRLTHPDGSRDFCASLGSEDKTLKLYPGLYHEIFNEPERDQVLADVHQWLESRLAAPA